MNKTKIEWCDYTWNPVHGCNFGCDYCYARGIASRYGLRDREGHLIEMDEPVVFNPDTHPHAAYPFGFTPTFRPERLGDPAKKTKGAKIFVTSMGDLFGDWVPADWIRQVFDVCQQAPQHTFMFLTKNPGRFQQWSPEYTVRDHAAHISNAWFGFTATCQADLDKRAFAARYFPRNTFISIEPLHGPINLKRIDPPEVEAYLDFTDGGQYWFMGGDKCGKRLKWVIIGAESGKGSNRVVPKAEWVADIVAQCATAGIPVFMKDSLLPIVGKNNMLRQWPQAMEDKRDS